MVRFQANAATMPSTNAIAAAAAATTTTTTTVVKGVGDWEVMFGRLQIFKKVKGHCHADQDADEPELGRWVISQRRQYQALTSHAKSSMTRERAQKLQELGLDLTVAVAKESTRDEAKKAASTSNHSKRKPKGVPAESHPETRRPPKKRKKSLEVVQGTTGTGQDNVEPEERDAAAGSDERGGGERQDVSPVVEKPVKGRGDSAWETLMNVAALVPPLPVAEGGPSSLSSNSSTASSVVSSSPQPQQQTPSKKAAKSKYGDLHSLPNAGGSYSSKYRAANNDVVPNQQRWEDMFARLEYYKQTHGHCRVPNRYSEDASLGSWVATQRRYFKNKNLPMPEDRVRRLTELGFEWTTKDPRKVPWETRFEDLISFKKKFGHADVPHEWEECPQLGFWTANMRQQYRYKQLGKKSSLTDDRIELLNSIGFVWKMQGGRRKKSDPVARPNQSTTSPSEVSSPESSVGERSPVARKDIKPLMLDPISAVGVASNYVPPPNMPTMTKQRAAFEGRGNQARPVAHYATGVPSFS